MDENTMLLIHVSHISTVFSEVIVLFQSVLYKGETDLLLNYFNSVFGLLACF